MIKYGLRNKKTGEFVGYSISSNEGADFSNEVAYALSEHEENIWLVDYAQHAEWVRLNSAEWYNANYETPENRLKPEDYEVVKYEIKAEKVYVHIPSDLKILESLYKEKEPGHLKNLKAQIKSGTKFDLGWGQVKKALGENIYGEGGILNKKVTFKELFQ